MKVYHYTSFSHIGEILGKQGNVNAGLEPRKGSGAQFPSLGIPKAIFGLLEPIPDNWANNPHFSITWKTLVYDLLVMGEGALLLEVELDCDIDQVFVGERAHLEGILYTDKANIPKIFLHENQNEAETAFMESLMPLNDYVGRQSRSIKEFSLPEVVAFSRIPVDQLIVSSLQPLIEEELNRKCGLEREYLISLITTGYAQSELSAWKKVYETKNGPLELQSRGKERR